MLKNIFLGDLKLVVKNKITIKQQFPMRKQDLFGNGESHKVRNMFFQPRNKKRSEKNIRIYDSDRSCHFLPTSFVVK